MKSHCLVEEFLHRGWSFPQPAPKYFKEVQTEIIKAREVKVREIEWLWYPYIISRYTFKR